MHNFLTEVTADCADVLVVKPQKVMPNPGRKNQIVHTFEDGRNAVVAVSNTSIFEVELQWTYVSEADRSTIFELFHASAKANGSARSFYWYNPIDEYIYTVRFLTPLRTVYKPGSLRSVETVKLRVEGFASLFFKLLYFGGYSRDSKINAFGKFGTLVEYPENIPGLDYMLDGYAFWPGTDNIAPIDKYRNFSGWTDSGGCTISQNAAGIDGAAATAWTVTGNDNTAHQSLRISLTINNARAGASLFIKKDEIESRFPCLSAYCTSFSGRVFLNTKTGYSWTKGDANDGGVLDCGDWWFFFLSFDMTSGQAVTFYLYPGGAAVQDGSRDVVAIGSIIVDWFQSFEDGHYYPTPFPVEGQSQLSHFCGPLSRDVVFTGQDSPSFPYVPTNELPYADPIAAVDYYVLNPVLTASDITDVAGVDFVADPILFIEDDVLHLFFEIKPTVGNGVIGHATSKTGVTWEYDQVVLQDENHHGLPLVFKRGGSYYMVPATPASSLYLYKSLNLISWENIASYDLGITIRDHAIIHKDDRWWIFVGTDDGADNGGLRLFYSAENDNIENMTLTAHPNNPIKTNQPADSRPGGRFMVLSDNRIIAFFQDCVAQYGDKIRVFEITTLTTTNYADSEITAYSPLLEASGETGTFNRYRMHHYDPWYLGDGNGWICAVDGGGDNDWSIGMYFINPTFLPPPLINIDLIDPEEGAIYLEYRALPKWDTHIDDAVILKNGDIEVRAKSSYSGVSVNDGTNDIFGPVGTPSGKNKVAIYWSGVTLNITANGSTVTGTFDNTKWSTSDGVYIGNNLIGNVFYGIIKNIVFSYGDAKDQAHWELETT